MTLNELIDQLQEIVKSEPNRGDLAVYVYPSEDTEIESPNQIQMIDNSILDRIDINISGTLSFDEPQYK